MSKRIYLAPSNQSANRYAAGGTNEAAVCQKIAEALVQALQSYDCTVTLGRQNQTIQKKAAEANALAADCYLSIHTNAGGGQGTEVWYHPEKPGARELALAVYGALAPVTPGKDRGIKTSTRYLDVTLPEMPCCLCEVDFHDNAAIAAWLIENTRPVAEALCRGLVAFLGLQKKTSAPTAIAAGDEVRIRLGANYYQSAKRVPLWVTLKTWIVEEVAGDRVVVNRSVDGKSAIKSPVALADLTLKAKPAAPTPTPDAQAQKEAIAKAVIAGKYGNGATRKKRIEAETPYTYAEIQTLVNQMLAK